MRALRSVFLFCLFAACASATNFAFVQHTPSSSTGALSQAFTSNNTAGNVIIAIVYYSSTATVSDTAGNTYHLIQGYLSSDPMLIYAATNINAGANTVTSTDGFGIVATEYSSTNPTYYVCPAVVALAGVVSNTGHCIPSDGNCVVSPVTFHSSSEVMAILAGTSTGYMTTWTVSSGTVRFETGFPADFGVGAMEGDDDQPSMTSTYANTLLDNGTTAGERSGAFLSLTPCSGSGVSSVISFPILY